MIIVKSINKAGSTWLVDYVEQLPCGCGFSQRKTVHIIQKNEPTTKQIENAIAKNK